MNVQGRITPYLRAAWQCYLEYGSCQFVLKGELDSFEWPENLEQAVQRLRDALVDYQEHSSTLKSLHDLVNELDSILTVETSSASMDVIASLPVPLTLYYTHWIS